MTIEKLYELQGNGFFNAVDNVKVNLLLQSINDWPNVVATVEEFLEEVTGYLHVKSITHEGLEKAIKKLNPADSSWEMESLTSLLELTSMVKGELLKEVLTECRVIENRKDG